MKSCLIAVWLVLFANLNTGFPADPVAGRPTKRIEGSAVLVSDEYRDWKHSGSIWLLTTPDGAELSAEAKVEQFPVLVRLHRDFFDFARAKPNGDDLRFSSSTG